jgi:Tfp pilus assembly protein PilF
MTSPDSTVNQPQQTVHGPQTNIAGGVYNTYYQHIGPAPVDEARLALACQRLAALPLDALPAPAALPPGSRLTRARNPLFVGREEDLKQLATTLKGGDTAAIGPIAALGQTAAATGLGGIGKSQLAIEFAHRYGQFFAGGVFWVSLANAEDVKNQVALCGGLSGMQLRPDYDALKLDDQVSLVLAEWQSPLPRLLIFDNCESEDLLRQWRPPTGGCRVLVTSRRATWDDALDVRPLALGILTRAESVTLLRKFRPDLTGLEDLSGLDALAAELGGLPLALHLAGSYLKRYCDDLTPAQFLAELRRPDLLNHPALAGRAAKLSPTDHENHVARTFALSYERLNAGDPVDGLALQVVAHAAAFARGLPIPRDLLKLTLPASPAPETAAGAAAPFPFAEAVLRLRELGLLEAEAAGNLTVHRLLARFVQGATPPAAWEAGLAAVEGALMNDANRVNEAGYPAPLRPWASHLRHVAEQAAARQSETAGTLFNEFGYHLYMEADHAGAHAAFQRALTLDEATFGPDHPNVARDVNNLGSVLYALGDHAGARAAFQRALTIDEAAFGPDHPKVAIRVNNLGNVLQDMGDHASARAAYQRALTIDKAAFGPDHPNVAIDVNNLGMVLFALGDHAGASAAFQRALTIDEATFGPDHPSVAIRVNNLGSVLQDMGDHAGARAAYQRALRIWERVFGPDHPKTRTARANLETLLKAEDDSGEEAVSTGNEPL